MRTQEGKAAFCPGCPNTGSFVGPVESDSFVVTSNDVDSIIGLRFTMVEAIDSDGMHSAPVRIRSTKSRQSRTWADSETSIDGEIEQMVKERGEVLTNRIAACVGHSATFSAATHYSIEHRACPALTAEVILQLIKNETERE